MEQAVLDGLQNLLLTKEEEKCIQITNQGRAELLKDWLLSLFGKLLSSRLQNQQALKGTLRAAWKMGSDLRILEVWGLPFELLSEETGKDIGNSIGIFVETDKRSGHTNQAKFMLIRVELQLDKPLRRGRVH
ncbi:hypothetical protein CFP56_011847 [Quercus suber]|uniref:Uncharacterized protein n=1 Tax=Quercus suber TaxID=58331 RepID=A0AAW0KZZ1_QUESU